METENLLPDDDFKKKNKLRLIILLPIIVLLLALLVCFIVLFVQERNKTKSDSNNENKKDTPDSEGSKYNTYIPFESWNNCTAKTKLSEFISKINSAENYVPKEDRIAVFIEYIMIRIIPQQKNKKKSLMILKSRRKKM